MLRAVPLKINCCHLFTLLLYLVIVDNSMATIHNDKKFFGRRLSDESRQAC